MALTLYVDTERWHRHSKLVAESYPGIVPVIKGNGYGFGNRRLASEASRLGVDLVAVGSHDELVDVADFGGDILVLTPVRPELEMSRAPNVIHTVSRLVDLQTLADGLPLPGRRRPRVAVELLSSIRRFGLTPEDLPMVRTLLDGKGVQFEGFALHLPLREAGTHRPEVERWIGYLKAIGLPTDRIFLSHLDAEEVAELSKGYPETEFRPRIGTALWLGDRESYRTRARVLDVHHVRRGDRFGYRQRRAAAEGRLVVVSGGTSHGVALEAPSHVRDLRTRARVLATSGLEAAGFALSPFAVDGQRRWFAEPPHMQVSVLFLPLSVSAPAIGEELDVNVGMTLTRFDRIRFD